MLAGTGLMSEFVSRPVAENAYEGIVHLQKKGALEMTDWQGASPGRQRPAGFIFLHCVIFHRSISPAAVIQPDHQTVLFLSFWPMAENASHLLRRWLLTHRINASYRLQFDFAERKKCD